MSSATQKVKPDVIHHLSIDNADDVTSTQMFFTGKAGVRLAIHDFNIFGEVDYIGLAFKKWHYYAPYTDEDDYERLKKIQIEEYLIPYPELSMSGPNYRVGVTYNFKNLTRIFGAL